MAAIVSGIQEMLTGPTVTGPKGDPGIAGATGMQVSSFVLQVYFLNAEFLSEVDELTNDYREPAPTGYHIRTNLILSS